MIPTKPPDYIRPIAVGIFKNENQILVFRGYDYHKREEFYRPLGGGLKFGETGAEALKREIREEMGAEIRAVKYLTAIENIFSLNNQPGHEIVLVYQAEFLDSEIYNKKHFQLFEDNLEPFDAYWKDLSLFESGSHILYPNGILEIINQI